MCNDDEMHCHLMTVLVHVLLQILLDVFQDVCLEILRTLVQQEWNSWILLICLPIFPSSRVLARGALGAAVEAELRMNRSRLAALAVRAKRQVTNLESTSNLLVKITIKDPRIELTSWLHLRVKREPNWFNDGIRQLSKGDRVQGSISERSGLAVVPAELEVACQLQDVRNHQFRNIGRVVLIDSLVKFGAHVVDLDNVTDHFHLETNL